MRFEVRQESLVFESFHKSDDLVDCDVFDWARVDVPLHLLARLKHEDHRGLIHLRELR